MNEPTLSRSSAPTLGILVSSADDKFENALLRGVSDAALQLGGNWICFTSGTIRSHHGFEFQRNILYDLVNPDVVNGLVVSGTLGHGVSHEELSRFCLNYSPIPVATVAVDLGNIPCVVSDGYRGIENAVNHLLNVHRKKRVAFIRGPVGHQEANERYRAYTAALTAYGLHVDPGLVLDGDYTIDSGRRVMDELIGRGVSFDAVACANDSMALGAMQVLREHGYDVPRDISLTGFDNIEEGRNHEIPLTTSQQLVYEMGWQAGRLLLAHLRGDEHPDRVVLPPSLIIRESCGCTNQELKNASYVFRPAEGFDAQQGNIVESVCRVVPGHLKERYKPLVESVASAFQADMLGDAVFIDAFKNMLLWGASIPGAEDFWHDILSAMRQAVLETAGSDFDVAKAEMLWGQARVLIGETGRNHEVKLRLQMEKRSVDLREISEMLMSSRRLADVLDVIVLELPRLGVRSCYLSLFEDVKNSLEWSRLILACDSDGRHSLEQGGLRFKSRQLLPENLFEGKTPPGLVAEALYSKEERLGFMLFEVDAQDSPVCGALRGLISSALQGVILQEQRERAEERIREYQRNLEKLVEERTFELSRANQELEGKNAELEQFAYTVSHDLKAPLVTIKGFLGYLREDIKAGNTPRLERDIERISEAAAKMHSLLSDLLELSRVGRMLNEPQDVPFASIVDDALELTAGRFRERKVVLNISDDLPVVHVDRQRLVEVVQNLLDNAVKFMGSQQSPRIEVGSAGTEAGLHILYIHDNGSGIAPEFHDRIFGLFNRLDPAVEGTGVGLTLVKRIIELHGGRIWIESIQGGGATFFFTLPRQMNS